MAAEGARKGLVGYEHLRDNHQLPASHHGCDDGLRIILKQLAGKNKEELDINPAYLAIATL